MKNNKRKKIIIISIVTIILVLIVGTILYMKYLTRNTMPTPKEMYDQRNYKIVYIKGDYNVDINSESYEYKRYLYVIADKEGKVIDTLMRITSEYDIVLQNEYYNYSNSHANTDNNGGDPNFPPFFSNVVLNDGVVSLNMTVYNGKAIEQLIYDLQHDGVGKNVEVIRL